MSSYPASLSIQIHPPAVGPAGPQAQTSKNTISDRALDSYVAAPGHSARTARAQASAAARSEAVMQLGKHFALIDEEELAKVLVVNPNAQDSEVWSRSTAWLIEFRKAAKIEKGHCVEKMYLVITAVQKIPRNCEDAVLQRSVAAYLELPEMERVGPHLSGLAMSRIIERQTPTHATSASLQCGTPHKRSHGEASHDASKKLKVTQTLQKPGMLPAAAVLTIANPAVRKLSEAFTNQKSSHNLVAIQTGLTAVHPNRVVPVANLVLGFFNALHWDKAQRTALSGLKHVIAAMDLVPPHLEKEVLCRSAARYSSVRRSCEDGEQMRDVILSVIAEHRPKQLLPLSPRHTSMYSSAVPTSASKPPPMTLAPDGVDAGDLR